MRSPRIQLRPDVLAALYEWNLRNNRRTTGGCTSITDPDLINKITDLALPDEDINDTILRLIRGGASFARH